MVVAALFPIMRCFKTNLSVKEAFVAAFGGLRGAVGLVLALSVLQDGAIRQMHGTYGAKVSPTPPTPTTTLPPLLGRCIEPSW